MLESLEVAPMYKFDGHYLLKDGLTVGYIEADDELKQEILTSLNREVTTSDQTRNA